ncbi:ion transporter, partial [Ursidibacter arcticus]
NFPKYFGSLENSIFSLFQIMTLESWSEGIVRPIMNHYPYAGFIFISFIFITSYCILNLVVGIIVSSMQQEAISDEDNLGKENDKLLQEIAFLKKQIQELTDLMNK